MDLAEEPVVIWKRMLRRFQLIRQTWEAKSHVLEVWEIDSGLSEWRVEFMEGKSRSRREKGKGVLELRGISVFSWEQLRRITYKQ